MDYLIRKLKKEEVNILEDFLYEAIYIPEGSKPPSKDILSHPDLQVYISDFGLNKDDISLVADIDGKIVGCIWARIMDDYGHIDDYTPSLSISVLKEYRNLGIGTALIKSMVRTLDEKGYEQVSLSVQKSNYATELYKRSGFVVYKERDNDLIMVLKLNCK